MTATFNKEYFDKVMEEATAEELAKKVDPNKTEKIFRKFSDNQLISLFKLDGADFYKRVLCLLGTLRITSANDKAIQQGIDEIKEAMGFNDEEAMAYLKENGIVKDEINGENTIKLAVGKILGFFKFTWDVVLVTLGFTSRVGVKFVSNLAKAVIDTGKYAVEEGKCAGSAIKDSWKRNMK